MLNKSIYPIHSPSLTQLKYTGLAEISYWIPLIIGKLFLNYVDGKVVGIFRIKRFK